MRYLFSVLALLPLGAMVSCLDLRSQDMKPIAIELSSEGGSTSYILGGIRVSEGILRQFMTKAATELRGRYVVVYSPNIETDPEIGLCVRVCRDFGLTNITVRLTGMPPATTSVKEEQSVIIR